jgi:hypothetical protein
MTEGLCLATVDIRTSYNQRSASLTFLKRILLLSKVAFKMPIKILFFCLFLTAGTFRR